MAKAGSYAWFRYGKGAPLCRKLAMDNLIEFIPIDGADHRFRDSRKMDLAIKYILEFYDLDGKAGEA